jgi:hypothetical protein
MRKEDKERLLKEYLDDERYKKEIENILRNPNVEEEKYNEMISKIIDLNDDSIGNLTLLSQNINSSIGNKLFREKRQQIINLDKTSKFIPPATKLVFLKYFTQEPKNLYKWDINDKKSYINEIKNKIKTLSKG